METLVTSRIPDTEQKTCSPFLSEFPAVSVSCTAQIRAGSASHSHQHNNPLAEAEVTLSTGAGLCAGCTLTLLSHLAHNSVPSLKSFPVSKHACS